MSAFGPKLTWAVALHMSAFEGKADMTVCGCLLSRSLLGVKRTCVAALHESAFDPKRTWLSRRKMFAFDPKQGFAALMSTYLLDGLFISASGIGRVSCRQCRPCTVSTMIGDPFLQQTHFAAGQRK